MTTFKVNVEKLNLRSGAVKDFDNKENIVGVLKTNAIFESERQFEMSWENGMLLTKYF